MLLKPITTRLLTLLPFLCTVPPSTQPQVPSIGDVVRAQWQYAHLPPGCMNRPLGVWTDFLWPAHCRDPESFEANKTIAVAIGVFASSVVLFSQFADLLVPA